jgi:ABC-type bacteriocin/lantibiotic exporter with double-glycine peptidase domain
MHAHLTADVLLGLTVISHFLIQAAGTLRLRAVRNKIAATIKDRSDLDEVRSAIQTNLLLGIPLLCNAALLIGVLIWLSNRWLWLASLLVLAVAQALAWLLFRPVERQFKALSVEGDDAVLAQEYAYYLQQWAGPHLFLKKRPHQDREQGAAPNAAPPHR